MNIKREWKEVIRWKPDNKSETTEAIVQISNDGIARRLEHKRWSKKNNSYSIIREHYYSKMTNRGQQVFDSDEKIEKNGLYEHYNINSKKYFAHQLVAKAFIPNPNNYKIVNHKNGIRNDNRAENLEWCTKKHNSRHAVETGLIKSDYHIKINDIEKQEIINLLEEGISPVEISKKINNKLSHETIRLISKKNINYKNVRKPREKKIIDYAEKRKKQKENFKLDYEEKNKIIKMIEDGNSKSLLAKDIKNLNQKLDSLYKEDKNYSKIINENSSLLSAIENKDRGIKQRIDTKKFIFSYGTKKSRIHHNGISRDNYNDALEDKKNFLLIACKDKKVLFEKVKSYYYE